MPRDVQKLYLLRAERVASLLAAVPFLRLVGLNGSVARGEAKPYSDIDVLIITAPKRLYLTRFLVTLILQILGVRRYRANIAGRICANRYQTSHHLTIEPKNEYHALVFSQLIPLFALGHIYQQYQVANQWMADFGQTVDAPVHRRSRAWPATRTIQKIGEWILSGRIGDYFEHFFRSWQQANFRRNPLTARYPQRIRFTDDILLFHPPAPAEVDTDLDRWDAAADAYDHLQGKVGSPFRRLVVDPVLFELLGDVLNQKILDAGCGNGYLTNQLAAAGARAVGVDGSAVMIARARQNFPDRTFTVADLTQALPFADSSFDRIVASMVLQDIPDAAQALGEWFRILKPTGWVVITLLHPCFAYPAGVARSNWLGRLLLGAPPKLEITDYLSQRRIVTPMAGLTVPTTRYHRPLEWYFQTFRQAGFVVDTLAEPALPQAAHRLPLPRGTFLSDKIPLILVAKLSRAR